MQEIIENAFRSLQRIQQMIETSKDFKEYEQLKQIEATIMTALQTYLERK